MLFNQKQLETLHALADRIIPPDDFPGAWEAGAEAYLSRQLQGDLKPALNSYLQGLDALEAEAKARAGVGFASLQAFAQDEILSQVEGGETRVEWATPPASFFQMIVTHLAEGYYSNSEQGGNRANKSWEMVGFTGK